MEDVDNMDFGIPQEHDKLEAKMDDLSLASNQQMQEGLNLEEFKNAIILYPAYFDSRKTEKQGRRVSKSLAINTDLKKEGIPLTAWMIAMSCGRLGCRVLIEEGKRYTRDYFGYGRVKVLLPENGFIKNKRKLIIKVAEMLRAVQLDSLNDIAKKAETSKTEIPVSAYTIPISPDYFPYGQHSVISNALKYGYGAVPMSDLRPKTNRNEETSGSTPVSGAKSKKKKK